MTTLACTPARAAWNAAHAGGPAAAPWILLGLARSKTLRFRGPVLVGTTAVAWGQELPLPEADGLLVMTAQIEPSLLGRVKAALPRHESLYL